MLPLNLLWYTAVPVFFSETVQASQTKHSPQRTADSAVDCINTEIGIFLSLCINATICLIQQRQMQLCDWAWNILSLGVTTISIQSTLGTPVLRLNRKWLRTCFLNGPFLASFLLLFGHYNFYSNIMWRNVHPVFEPTTSETRVSSQNH